MNELKKENLVKKLSKEWPVPWKIQGDYLFNEVILAEFNFDRCKIFQDSTGWWTVSYSSPRIVISYSGLKSTREILKKIRKIKRML